jgi:hypothetical protein
VAVKHDSCNRNHGNVTRYEGLKRMIGNVQVIASQIDELSWVLQGFSRSK